MKLWSLGHLIKESAARDETPIEVRGEPAFEESLRWFFSPPGLLMWMGLVCAFLLVLGITGSYSAWQTALTLVGALLMYGILAGLVLVLKSIGSGAYSRIYLAEHYVRIPLEEVDQRIRYRDILRIDAGHEDVVTVTYRARLGPISLGFRRDWRFRPVEREVFVGELSRRVQDALENERRKARNGPDEHALKS
jgi:hypothetical protein